MSSITRSEVQPNSEADCASSSATDSDPAQLQFAEDKAPQRGSKGVPQAKNKEIPAYSPPQTRNRKRQRTETDLEGTREGDGNGGGEAGAESSSPAKKKKKKKRPAKKRGPNMPIRPQGPYMHFLAHYRVEHARELYKLQAKDIGRIAGKAWRELSEEEKEPYIQRAEEDKARYAVEMEQYRLDNVVVEEPSKTGEREPRRPKGPFIFYLEHFRAETRVWKTMDADARKPFVDAAKAMRDVYALHKQQLEDAEDAAVDGERNHHHHELDLVEEDLQAVLHSAFDEDLQGGGGGLGGNEEKEEEEEGPRYAEQITEILREAGLMWRTSPEAAQDHDEDAAALRPLPSTKPASTSTLPQEILPPPDTSSPQSPTSIGRLLTVPATVPVPSIDLKKQESFAERIQAQIDAQLATLRTFMAPPPMPQPPVLPPKKGPEFTTELMAREKGGNMYLIEEGSHGRLQTTHIDQLPHAVGPQAQSSVPLPHQRAVSEAQETLMQLAQAMGLPETQFTCTLPVPGVLFGQPPVPHPCPATAAHVSGTVQAGTQHAGTQKVAAGVSLNDAQTLQSALLDAAIGAVLRPPTRSLAHHRNNTNPFDPGLQRTAFHVVIPGIQNQGTGFPQTEPTQNASSQQQQTSRLLIPGAPAAANSQAPLHQTAVLQPPPSLDQEPLLHAFGVPLQDVALPVNGNGNGNVRSYAVDARQAPGSLPSAQHHAALNFR